MKKLQSLLEMIRLKELSNHWEKVFIKPFTKKETAYPVIIHIRVVQVIIV